MRGSGPLLWLEWLSRAQAQQHPIETYGHMFVYWLLEREELMFGSMSLYTLKVSETSYHVHTILNHIKVMKKRKV